MRQEPIATHVENSMSNTLSVRDANRGCPWQMPGCSSKGPSAGSSPGASLETQMTQNTKPLSHQLLFHQNEPRNTKSAALPGHSEWRKKIALKLHNAWMFAVEMENNTVGRKHFVTCQISFANETLAAPSSGTAQLALDIAPAEIAMRKTPLQTSRARARYVTAHCAVLALLSSKLFCILESMSVQKLNRTDWNLRHAIDSIDKSAAVEPWHSRRQHHCLTVTSREVGYQSSLTDTIQESEIGPCLHHTCQAIPGPNLTQQCAQLNNGFNWLNCPKLHHAYRRQRKNLQEMRTTDNHDSGMYFWKAGSEPAFSDLGGHRT